VKGVLRSDQSGEYLGWGTILQCVKVGHLSSGFKGGESCQREKGDSQVGNPVGCQAVSKGDLLKGGAIWIRELSSRILGNSGKLSREH